MPSPGSIRQVAPDRIEIREGGGCLALFGLPFLAAGLCLLLVALRILPLQNARQVPAWAWPLIGLMGLAFVVVGGGLVFGRRWILLDAGRGLILKQWGLLVPLRSQELRLADHDAVLLRFEAGGSDSADRYPVLLRGAGGQGDLPLTSSPLYGVSREGAAAVARCLRLPLVDASTHRETVLAPDRAEATLQERLRAGEEPRPEAARPLRMRSRVQESSQEVRIEIPGPGFRPGALLRLAVPAGFLLLVAPDLLEFFRRTRTPEGVQAAIFGVAVLVLVLLPLLGVINAVALARRGGTRVTAAPSGIVVEERSAWRVKTTRLPAGDILGLDCGTAAARLGAARREAQSRAVHAGERPAAAAGRADPLPAWLSWLARLAPSRGIIVQAKGDLITFGAGLPDEELRYLHALIARHLGGEGTRW